METGIIDNGLIGAIAATVWFFHRYAQLEADYSNQMPRAARVRALALVLTAGAIPVASGLVFVIVIAMLSGPSLLGFDGPTWYVGALVLMFALVLLVEGAIGAYRLRARADTVVFEPRRPPAWAANAEPERRRAGPEAPRSLPL